MTDERVDNRALLAMISRLPKKRAGVVFRHYATDAKARRALFERVRAIARQRQLLLLLAGDARTAAAWQADGWHGWDVRQSRKMLMHSMPVHDAREMVRARQAAAELIFLSPLFPTRSHPGARALGRARFAALARTARMPVIALGGVRAAHGQMLRGIGAAGWAAIDGLACER